MGECSSDKTRRRAWTGYVHGISICYSVLALTRHRCRSFVHETCMKVRERACVHAHAHARASCMVHAVHAVRCAQCVRCSVCMHACVRARVCACLHDLVPNPKDNDGLLGQARHALTHMSTHSWVALHRAPGEDCHRAQAFLPRPVDGSAG